jgi:hypothetical protein
MKHTRLHRVPTAYREERDDDHKAQEIRGGEADMYWQTLQLDPSRMLYPTPRSV